MSKENITHEEQLRRWVEGDSVCIEDGCCCPDFSCCVPELKFSDENRRKFVEDPTSRPAFMVAALHAAMVHAGKHVHIVSDVPQGEA